MKHTDELSATAATEGKLSAPADHQDKMADDTPASVPNMLSWADEAEESDSEATDEEEEARLEAEEQAAEAQRIEDEWNGPRAEGATLEDLADALDAQALANGERDEDGDSNSDSDEDDDEPEPEPSPIPARKVPELEKQLSKKELKKLADAAFEAELLAAMGEVGETAPAADKSETKAEAPAAAAENAAPAGESAAAKKKRKKKAKKKAGGGGAAEVEAAAASPETETTAAAAETAKPLSDAEIEAKKKALAAKMARGDVKKAAERKKKAEKQKEVEKKRKEAAKNKKYAASAGVSGPKFSGDNAVGGDGRGG